MKKEKPYLKEKVPFLFFIVVFNVVVVFLSEGQRFFMPVSFVFFHRLDLSSTVF